jgi:actin related protein 2/3 complex subunit 1A/1B
MLISGVDWNHRTNCIVTASHDRNAFVWNEEAGADGAMTWKPSLVILRIDKSALDVRWSPNGLKFAAASGAKCVSVCSFADEDNWWVSKTIKKHKSTVLCLAWHPNSEFLATGSSDFKCRVFSAFVRQIDNSQDSLNFTPKAFGEDCWEAGAYGWVDSVCWSPSGNTLAFTGHDSSIQFVDFTTQGDKALVESIRFQQLPIEDCRFVSETALVGVGHEMNPLLFSKKSGSWAFDRKLEEKKVKEMKEAKATSGVAAARALFQNKTKTGQDSAKKGDKLETTHETSISCMQILETGKFTTTAMDGKMVFWDFNDLSVGMAALGI